MKSPWFGRMGRQIVRDILMHVAIATLAGLSLFIAIDFVETGNLAERTGAASDLLLLEVAGLPVVYQQIATFTALIGTLTAMAALSRRQELVAMLAAGASPLAFFKPALVAGLILAATYAGITEWIVPPARTTTTALRRQLGLGTQNTDVLRTGRMWFKGKDRIYRVEDLEDEGGRVLGGVMMLIIDGGRLSQRYDVDRLRHDQGSWHAEGLLHRRFLEDGSIQTTQTATGAMTLFERPDDFVRSVGAPDRLPFTLLYESTQARERLGQPAVQHRLELYRRIGLPLTIWLAVALGAGLAMALGRRPGLALAMGVGTGLGFTLWLMDEMSVALSTASAFDPIVAAQFGPWTVFAGVLWAWSRALRKGVRD